MDDPTILVRLPDGFDALLRAHAERADIEITDLERRAFVVALLAAVMDGLNAPQVAAALIRLNGALPLVPPGTTVH